MGRRRQIRIAPDQKVLSALRTKLSKMGLHYRLMDQRYPGPPHIMFHSRKVAIFGLDCQSYRHPPCARIEPEWRADLWPLRDWNLNRKELDVVEVALANRRVQMEVVWGCEIKAYLILEGRLQRILGAGA